MRYSVAPVAFAAFVAANPVPQGVTQEISPDAATPSGCQTSYDGTFVIQIVNQSDVSINSRRAIHKRQSDILALTLQDGVLTDSEDRTGYIAANSQFQFDAPPQTGAIYTAGWSVCGGSALNGRLTLGADDQFYSCLSGDFYNLYDENVLDTDQCTPVYIDVVDSSSAGGAASVMPDGQPTGSAVSVMPDGQPTGSAVEPITQISDGQVQASSAVAPVTQISDGQVQATSAVVPVTQISDGQIQATSAVAPVTQISDGQIQATSAVVPVTQISDGQIQAPSGTGYMPTANGTMAYPSPSVAVQTGAASVMQVSSGLGLFAAIFGVALF